MEFGTILVGELSGVQFSFCSALPIDVPFVSWSTVRARWPVSVTLTPGDGREGERKNEANKAQWVEVVVDETEELGVPAVLKLLGGGSTSEQGADTAKLGTGDGVEASRNKGDILGGVTRGEEGSGVDGGGEVGISCVVRWRFVCVDGTQFMLVCVWWLQENDGHRKQKWECVI